MKTFYEMLRILESEQVKTPGGYTLTPEELEEYENERSPMYKALMLKDIDAKRKAEEENRPENIVSREEERRKQEDEREARRQREREELEREREELEIKEKEKVKSLREKFDYIIKASGLLLSELPNQAIEGVMASLGIKKENSNWIIKTHAGNFPVDLYNGPMDEPKEDRDYAFLERLIDLLILEWRGFSGINRSTGESDPLKVNKKYTKAIENIFDKIGVEKTGEIGEKLNFNGIYQDTISDVEVGQEVVIRIPGFILKTPRGPMLISKSIVEPT